MPFAFSTFVPYIRHGNLIKSPYTLITTCTIDAILKFCSGCGRHFYPGFVKHGHFEREAEPFEVEYGSLHTKKPQSQPLV